MALTEIKKELAGVEDLLLGVGTDNQTRGELTLPITKINGSHIPYDETDSINDKIDANSTNITNNYAATAQSVDTIAVLRAVTEPVDRVWVSGYHTKGDGAFGSNIFEWDATITEDDNGGTIIKLDSVATGRYKLKYEGSVNTSFFGSFYDYNLNVDTEVSGTEQVDGGIDFNSDSNVTIAGVTGNSVTNITPDTSTFVLSGDGSTRLQKPIIEKINITGPTTGTGNGNGAIKLRATDNGSILHNNIKSYEGIRVGYGDTTLGPYSGNPATEDQPLRQSINNIVMGNYAKVANLGIELIGSTQSQVLGNIIEGTVSKAGSHGIRLTGFPGMPNEYTAIIGNSIDSKLTGLSIQSAAKYNSILGLQVNDTVEGIQQNPNVTYENYWSSFNNVQAIVNDSTSGAKLYNYNHSKLDLIADNCSSGLSLFDNNSIYGEGKNSIVDAIISNCSSDGMYISGQNNSIFRIVMSDIARWGLRLEGDRNIIDIIIDDAGRSNYPIDIQGSNNIIRVIQDESTTTYPWDIDISGNSNSIDATNVDRIYISGTNNKVRATSVNYLRVNETAGDTTIEGDVAEFRFDSVNTTLDKINLSGLSCASRGVVGATTDASGQYSFTVDNIPIGISKFNVDFNLRGSDSYIATVSNASVSSNILTVIITLRNISDGSLVVSTPFNATYVATPIALNTV